MVYLGAGKHISYVPDVVCLPHSWSLQLCGFLYFPPLHTVRATFTAHGVPSTNPRRLEVITPVLITSTIIAATSAFQHRFGCLLFFVSLHPFLRMSNTFPRSDNPIRYHTPLGACYGTEDFFDGFSYASPHSAISSTHIAVRTVSLYFAGSSASYEACSPWVFYGPPAYQLAS